MMQNAHGFKFEELASSGRRCFGRLIDVAIIGIVSLVIGLSFGATPLLGTILGSSDDGQLPDFNVFLSHLLTAAFITSYHIFPYTFASATPGKMMVGIVVKRMNGDQYSLDMATAIRRSLNSILLVGVIPTLLTFYEVIAESLVPGLIFTITAWINLGIGVMSLNLLNDLRNPKKTRQTIMDEFAGTVVVNKATVGVKPDSIVR